MSSGDDRRGPKPPSRRTPMDTTREAPASYVAGSTPALAATLRRVIATPDDRAALVARVALALLIFPHGAQHALGWFGGYGFGGTFKWMTGTLGFPAPA